jgi:hypothetical protein
MLPQNRSSSCGLLSYTSSKPDPTPFNITSFSIAFFFSPLLQKCQHLACIARNPPARTAFEVSTITCGWSFLHFETHRSFCYRWETRFWRWWFEFSNAQHQVVYNSRIHYAIICRRCAPRGIRDNLLPSYKIDPNEWLHPNSSLSIAMCDRNWKMIELL